MKRDISQGLRLLNFLSVHTRQFFLTLKEMVNFTVILYLIFFVFVRSKLSLKFHIFCASITLFIHMSVLQIYSILDLVALIGDIHHINEEFVFEICLLFFASIGTQLLILCK